MNGTGATALTAATGGSAGINAAVAKAMAQGFPVPPGGLSVSQAAIGMLVSQIGSANWANWQWDRWTYYDHVRVTNAAASNNQIVFFTNVGGAVDPVSGLQKNLEWTNLTQQGQFGQQYFIIQEIRTLLALVPKARQNATVAATTTYTYDQFVATQRLLTAWLTGVFDMVIGNKNYFHIAQPFRTAPPGFGVTQVIVPYDLTTSATGNAYASQSNALADVWGVSPPQLIEPSQQFTATISFPDLGYNFHNCLDASGQNANVEAGCYLDGYLFRPVQ
jgi:hypothetical protein